MDCLYSAGDPGLFRQPWRALKAITCVDSSVVKADSTRSTSNISTSDILQLVVDDEIIRNFVSHLNFSISQICFVSKSTMSQWSHLTDSEAWRVVGRLEGGQTQAEVVQAIGVS
ncbi:hypothetical protein TNCV_646791 [Trichonephila clavipes]|nr:hypothetical protein TNCV_646791 [Trichonephila clavipes]